MKLTECFAAAAAEQNANVLSVVSVKNGKWNEKTIIPAAPCQNCYSVTKSFTATAVGLCADKGLLSPDTPVTEFFGKELPDNFDQKFHRVTVKHLLTHTAGFEKGFLFEDDRVLAGKNWLEYTLSKPLAFEPGEIFVYNNAGYYLLSCIVHRVTGKTAERFLREELFAPLGITNYAWSSSPEGETEGGTGLYLSSADMAKLGLLYLGGGVYGGRRILSENWVREATLTHFKPDDMPWGYGYSFWTYPGTDDFRCDGAHQQIVLVLPGKNTVVSFHSYTDFFDYYGIVDNAPEEAE